MLCSWGKIEMNRVADALIRDGDDGDDDGGGVWYRW